VSGTAHRIFRLSGSVPRDPAVNAWLDARAGQLGTVARHWFGVIRRSGQDVREAMHDGLPTGCVGDAAFAYVGAFTAHVSVGFFHGAALPDPDRLLRGSGKHMRHVRLEAGAGVDDEALAALIDSAYADIVRRLDADREALGD